MAHPLYEVEEEILKRLDVKDLLRCKSVCKSWSILLSSPRFIKAHLNHQYDNDHDDERFRHRRITISKEAEYISRWNYAIDDNFFGLNDRHLIGSSNGLVCVSPSPAKILVVNPSTREVKKVTKHQIPETDSLCWGFGYDSSTDDYKLVLGFKKDENHTCFQVFSLRSNAWKVTGEINYVFSSRVGILCKGALHWLAYAYDTSSEKKNVILSFHFSEEKFLEVPMPDDVKYHQLYNFQHSSMRLGTMNECLCLYPNVFMRNVWVMNKERSWEMFGRERAIKDDAVHNMKLLKNYIPNKRPLCHEIWSHNHWVRKSRVFLGTPIYVESLVSPHFHKKLRRKRRATNTLKSPKVRLQL
ncbi:putative F-box domain-containing protein [Helianthus annuus]|nr:putative F-box domain-containing protein [Helianthus annuus]KAJ0730200.1 putative F-box domain-containing protein [Helianthus annuus]